jgi:hypothetical protein
MIIRKGEQMTIYNFYLKEHITGESELLLASCTEREAMIEMGAILENNHNNGFTLKNIDNTGDLLTYEVVDSGKYFILEKVGDTNCNIN